MLTFRATPCRAVAGVLRRYHSSYVASRLGIWKEPGRRKLNTFLAKMGMPLNQCRQKWAHMKFGLKTELKARVLQYSAEFGLEQLTYGSFEKLNGFRQRISAADAVYSVGALLEERGEIGSTVEDAHALNVRNFWSAYSALAGEGEEGAGGAGSGAGGAQSKLEHGVHQAIAQQQLVVHQGTIVIEKRIMTDCGKHFRWITLKGACTQPLSSTHAGRRAHARRRACTQAGARTRTRLWCLGAAIVGC